MSNCVIKAIDDVLGKLSSNKSEERAKLEKARTIAIDSLLEKHVAAAAAKGTSTRTAINMAIESTEGYQELLKQLDELNESNAKAKAKQNSAYESIKKYGGKNALGYRQKNLVNLESRISDLEDDITAIDDDISRSSSDKWTANLNKQHNKLVKNKERLAQYITDTKKQITTSKRFITQKANAENTISDLAIAREMILEEIRDFRKRFTSNEELITNAPTNELGKKLPLNKYFSVKGILNTFALAGKYVGNLFGNMVKIASDKNAINDNIAGAIRLMDYTVKYIENSIAKDMDMNSIFMSDIGPAADKEGWQSISRLLSVDVPKSAENGWKASRKLSDKTVTAMAAALNNWMVNSGSMRWDQRSPKDINRFLGRDENTPITPKEYKALEGVDTFRDTAAADIGADIVKQLGIISDTDKHKYSPILFDKLKVELGLMAIQAAKSNKFISEHKKPVKAIYGDKATSDNDIYYLTFEPLATKMIDSKSKSFQKAVEAVNDVIGLDSKQSKPRFSKRRKAREHANKSSQGKWFTTPKKIEEALNKLENIATTFDNDYVMEIANAMNDEEDADRLLRYLGYKDEASVHAIHKLGTKAHNNALKLQINNMLDLYNEMYVNGKTEMFFDYFFGKNHRLYLDSSLFNPQSIKLHRFAVYQAEAEIENEADEKLVMLAMAQAFGVDIDKLTIEHSLEEYAKRDKYLRDIISEDKPLIDILEELRNLSVPDFDEGIKGHDPEHMIAGVVEYKRMLAYKKANGSLIGYTSHLPLEVDAVTSGYILKSLQLPVLNNVNEHLASGGFMVADADGNFKYESIEELIEDPDTLDSYERPAKPMLKKVQAMSKGLEPGGQQERAASLALGMDINKVDANNNDVIKKFRKFMKSPFMVFNYGAGMGSVINSVVYGSSNAAGAVTNLYKILEDAVNSEDADALENGIVRFKNELKAITTLYEVDEDNEVIEIPVDKKVITENLAKFDKAINDDAILDFELTDELMTAFTSGVREGIGRQLQDVFKEQYKPYIEASKTINASFAVMFKLFKARLDRAIAAAQKHYGRDITAEEYDEIVDALSDHMPAIKTVLAEADTDRLLIANDAAVKYETLEDAKITGQGKYRLSNGKFASAYAKKYRLIEAGAAGAVIPIHAIDGSLISEGVLSTTALGIHDALLLLPKAAKEGAEAYNEAAYELSKEYSLTYEVYSQFNNIVGNASVEEILEVNNELAAEAADRGDPKPPNVSKVLEGMSKLHKAATAARSKLFANDVRIEHIAFEGSAVDKKGSEITSNVIDGTNAAKKGAEAVVATVNNLVQDIPSRAIDGNMNHTGGAYGADGVWANMLRPYGVANNHYIPTDNKRSKNNSILEAAGDNVIHVTKEEMDAGSAFNSLIGNNAYALNNRNIVQVINADKIFAVAPIKNGKVMGGTGSAVRMAEALGKDVYVLDINTEEWFKSSDKGYVKYTGDIDMTGNIAAVGTRDIESYWGQKEGKYLGDAKSKSIISKMQEAVDSSFKDVEKKDSTLDRLAKVDTSNVVAKPPFKLDKGKDLWTMRISEKQLPNFKAMDRVHNFGNPFMTGNYASMPLESETARGSSELAATQYYEWLVNSKIPSNYTGDTKQLAERRKYILDNLKYVKKAKNLIYSGTVKDGKISHVNALIAAAEDVKEPVKDTVSPQDNTSSKKEPEAKPVVDKTANKKTSEETKQPDVKKDVKPKDVQKSTEVAGLTPSQQQAHDDIVAFVESDNDHYVLSGAGGTGKTYVIGKVLETLVKKGKLAASPNSIGLIAPTNKAASTLEAAVKSPTMPLDAYTVHAGLAIEVKDDIIVDGKIVGSDSVVGDPKVDAADLIVVDESSMLSEALVEKIIRFAKGKGAKVLFMGDKAQLKPVRDKNDVEAYERLTGERVTLPKLNEKVALMFEPSVSLFANTGKSDLTENKRFKEDSGLGRLINNAREQVIGNLEGKGSSKPITLSAEFIAEGEEQGNVSEETDNTYFKKFIELYEEDPENTRIITYNNEVNKNSQSVGSINKKVREVLNPAHMDDFIAGDRAIVYDKHVKMEGDTVVTNAMKGDNILIEAATIPAVTTFVSVGKFGNLTEQVTINVEVQRVNATNVTPDGTIRFDAIAATNKGKKTLATLMSNYQADADIAGKNGDKFAKIQAIARKKAVQMYKNSLLDIQFAYVANVHKAQGDSISNVFVMKDNILGNPMSSNEDKSQALYTAISRAKQKLFIISGNRSNVVADEISDFEGSYDTIPLQNNYSEQSAEAIDRAASTIEDDAWCFGG